MLVSLLLLLKNTSRLDCSTQMNVEARINTPGSELSSFAREKGYDLVSEPQGYTTN
jgi:hypothetical protein